MAKFDTVNHDRLTARMKAEITDKRALRLVNEYLNLSQPQWPSPNLDMLNNALVQSGWEKDNVTANNWPGYVLKRLERLDWAQVVADVQRFLMK